MSDDPALTLDSLQRDVLAPQIQAFLDATSDPAAREVYLRLRDAVDRLEVPPDLAARLGAIVEVALQSGRIRKLFGAGADLALNALFQRTPRGREIAESIVALNIALARLKGQPIDDLSATLRAPGSYSLTIRTASCQIVIRFEQAGVRVESLELETR